MHSSSTYKLVCAVMSLIAWASAPASAAANIHVICRGGPVTLQGRTSDLVGHFNLSLWFKRFDGPKTTVRPDGSHLAPGECSLTFAPLWESWGSHIEYNTFAENFYWSTLMQGTSDHNSPETSAGWLRLNPLSTDSNLLFVPKISPTPDVDSIFDPNIVWHMYVQRADGYLALQYLTFP